MKKKDYENGIWRTIGGRRVFIRKGQDLSSAMKESGKFKTKMNEKAVKGVREEDLKDQYIESLNNVSKMEYNGEITRDEYDEAIKNINKEYKNRKMEDKFYTRKDGTKEYELYKRAKENPDSIDPMTENSTDWEALDKKYSDRYEKERNTYESKVFGTDVTKADEQMKKTFGEDFKYDEEKNIRGSNGKAIDFNTKDDTFKYTGSYNRNKMDKARADSIMIEKLGSKAIEEIKNGNITDETQLNDYLDYGNSVKSKAKPGYGYGYYELQRSEMWRDDLRNTQAHKEINAQANYWREKAKNELQQNTLPKKYKGTIEYLQSTTNMTIPEIYELLKKIDEDRK